ncbi:hypothetical protein SLE2022_213200 [Rubroshorea leprosula]
MASSFDRWEKDPFFYAAEEVQESADRMESTYRTWLHAKKDTSDTWKFEELRRDLNTTLGTTKWQLEEFEKAVQSSYKGGSSEGAKDRHLQFIAAIEDQIANIEKSLRESALSDGKTTLPWVQLDKGERDELAWFLSAPSQSEDNKDSNSNGKDDEIPQEMEKEPVSNSLKNSRRSVDWGSSEARGEKSHGHRRTASASADIGDWQIVIADAGFQHNPAKGQPPLPPRKIPSFSRFLNSMETASKLKWSMNGAKKWKAVDCQQETDLELLRSPQMTRGINACCEKSKSSLGCDDCYDKQLHGWYGAIQRKLQRSQYQVQHSRVIKIAFSIVLFICLIVLLAIEF